MNRVYYCIHIFDISKLNSSKGPGCRNSFAFKNIPQISEEGQFLRSSKAKGKKALPAKATKGAKQGARKDAGEEDVATSKDGSKYLHMY